jgi:hypothetical protein
MSTWPTGAANKPQQAAVLAPVASTRRAACARQLDRARDADLLGATDRDGGRRAGYAGGAPAGAASGGAASAARLGPARLGDFMKADRSTSPRSALAQTQFLAPGTHAGAPPRFRPAGPTQHGRPSSSITRVRGERVRRNVRALEDVLGLDLDAPPSATPA